MNVHLLPYSFSIYAKIIIGIGKNRRYFFSQDSIVT
jgi:hypothetical protein